MIVLFFHFFFPHLIRRVHILYWQRFRMCCSTRTPTRRDENNRQHYLTFRLFLFCVSRNEIRYDQTGDQRILRQDHEIRRSKVRFGIRCEKERFRG